MSSNLDYTHSKFRDALEANFLYSPQDTQSLVLLGALQFIKFRELKSGVQCLNKAIECDPTNVDAHFWLGACYYHCFFVLDEAEKNLFKALALDPKRSDCLSLMAYINWDKKFSLETSLSYLRQAIVISPDWPMLRIEIVYLLLNLGRFKEAEQEIEQAELLLKQSAKIPANAVEEYYEKFITGRSWTNLAERLEQLKLNLVKYIEKYKKVKVDKESNISKLHQIRMIYSGVLNNNSILY